MPRPRGNRVWVLAETENGKYSIVEVSPAWANVRADHRARLDKIRAESALKPRHRKSRKAKLRR